MRAALPHAPQTSDVHGVTGECKVISRGSVSREGAVSVLMSCERSARNFGERATQGYWDDAQAA